MLTTTDRTCPAPLARFSTRSSSGGSPSTTSSWQTLPEILGCMSSCSTMSSSSCSQTGCSSHLFRPSKAGFPETEEEEELWGRELQAVVKGLGAGHIFLTQPAADLHWPDLMRHLPRYQKWLQADANQRIRIARENLRDNPHIAAFWFHFRWQTFLHVILELKLKVVDFWSRYLNEWRGRGSTHAYSILWIESAPASEDLLTPELRVAFARFWGIHIIAINREPNRRPLAATKRPVIQFTPAEQSNSMDQLSDLVNRVQPHVCSDKYCMRVNRRIGNTECRFRYPMPLRDEP